MALDRKLHILTYLYKNNCKTEFCDIKSLVEGWTGKEIIDTLCPLQIENKIMLSGDSNINSLGSQVNFQKRTVENSTIKAIIKDEGEKYYENIKGRKSTNIRSIIAIVISIISLLYVVIKDICKYLQQH